jgi:hypothetical protein
LLDGGMGSQMFDKSIKQGIPRIKFMNGDESQLFSLRISR